LGSEGKWDILDGRILKFKNSARPQKRFLYLRYVMTMLHAWRHKQPGYETLRSNIWPSRLIWAPPGKYVRSSSLQSIGGMIREHFDQTFDDDENEHCSTETSEKMKAKFESIVDELGLRRDDEDDE
jgi:hypothetical protein